MYFVSMEHPSSSLSNLAMFTLDTSNWSDDPDIGVRHKEKGIDFRQCP